MTTRGKEEKQRPFFSMFLRRGVEAGNGEMACFDRGCAHVVAVIARTRRVVMLDGGGVGSGRLEEQLPIAAGLLMLGEKSMPAQELLHLR